MEYEEYGLFFVKGLKEVRVKAKGGRDPKLYSQTH